MAPGLLSFRPHSSPWYTRRPSAHAVPADKGKTPARRSSEHSGHGAHRPLSPPLPPADREPSAPPPPFTSSSSSSNTSKKGQRASMLVTASEALGFKFRRQRPSTRQPLPPVILDDVIEITARKRDEEEEERSRLRAEAAQAMGLDPLLVDPDVQSRHDTTDDEEEDTEELGQTQLNSVHSLAESRTYAHNARSSTHASHIHTGLEGSSTSVVGSSPPPPMPVGRYRPGSLVGGHSRTNSANLTPIPPYPSAVSALAQWQQHTGTLPKYYPSSSLRIFALSNSRNWKARYIMLTSPAAIVTRTRAPAVSYLHLFKGSGPDEKELERLAINEDSVVFVSDDGVGGRQHVIKVGGTEAGAFKKELNVEESGRTMWFLHIQDPADSQQWISGIKNSILNQRAIRAGLFPAAATSFGVNEPRGDIDVMLSMRAQGFITSSTNSNTRYSTPPSAITQAEKIYASSISEHSVRSQASSPKGPIAVSTLKGLFSASRPRSGSRATSVDTTKPHQQQHDQNEDKDTFSSMGNSLMSMLRSATPDLQSQSSGATVVRTNSPFLSSVTPDIGIDRKIVPDRQPLQFVTNDPPLISSHLTASRGAKALSIGSMSLQPPPRKRWNSSAVSPIVKSTSNQLTPDVYQNADYNGTTGSLGALTYYKDNQETGSPTHTAASMTGTSESNPLRPPSVQSVSTYASNENSLNVDRSSTSTKQTSSSMRRWSRQGSLPPRTSPPSGPPPNPPGSGSRATPIVGEANRPASRASSVKSGQSQQSIVSSLPSFSKRTSVSSVGTTSSNSHSANGPTVGRHRASMPPPPRPAPTSALPPAPGERRNNRPCSVDSMPKPSSSPTKGKRVSSAGRGFRLSMMAPGKPPPSSNLPPRPDELVGQIPPTARRFSAGNSRLSRLNPIPASPDPGAAPFPPPRGPLPPTPGEGASNSDPNANRPSTGVSRHTSLKQRLRILSAPSSTSSTNAPSTNNANVSSDPNNTLSNTSTHTTTTTNTNTHSRPNPPSTRRLSGSGFHHNRTSSTGNATPSHSHSDHNQSSDTNNNASAKSRKSAPPPLISTPSYLSMTNSQPATPIGEKILSFQEESSFLNLTTPISPSVPLPPLSSPRMSMSMSMSMSMPIRPLPAIPVSSEVTPLSPPPRRNSKQIVIVEPRPSPPRTPSTPSIFEQQSKSGGSRTDDRVLLPLPLIPTDTFGPATTPSLSAPPKQLPLLLSLPPSPSLEPSPEERSATPPDSPSQEIHRMSPSSPASVTSFGMMNL